MKGNRPRIKISRSSNLIRTKTSSNLALLKSKRKDSEKRIKVLDELISETQKSAKEFENKKKTLIDIENSFKKKGILNQLRFYNQYKKLKDEIKNAKIKSVDHIKSELSILKANLLQLTKEISQIEAENEKKKKLGDIENDITKNKALKPEKIKDSKESKKTSKELKTNSSIGSLKALPKVPNYLNVKEFEADWDQIFFLDYKIIIKYNEHSFEKHVPKSKKFINKIKDYYKFHNVPKLKVVVENSVVRIENEEVLFYHIDFLNISAAGFGYFEVPKFNMKNWEKYTKSHYKTSLSYLFHTFTLRKLSQICDDDLPIIPVGEAVINSNGIKKIDNSFLFPIKSASGLLLVWESAEDGKASYVFSIKNYSSEVVQDLYDFIAGDTINKRLTLINSKLLQLRFKMKVRLLHSDLREWENSLSRLINSK